MSVKMRMPKLTESLSAPLQTETKPYLMKPVPVGNRERLKLIGGTVAHNQLFPPKSDAFTATGYTVTGNNDGSFTITVTASSASYTGGNETSLSSSVFISGHKYIMLTNDSRIQYRLKALMQTSPTIISVSSPSYSNVCFVFMDLATGTYTVKPQLIDLTQMFGSTIADYAYTLEQGHAGDGIAWLKSYGFFNKDFFPFDSGSLLSVKTSGHKMVGRNRLPNNATSLTHNDVTFTVNADGSITANGTATGEAYCNIVVQGTSALAPYLEVGTEYTINGCPSGGGSTKYRFQVQHDGVWATDNGNGQTFIYTAGGTDRARVHVASGYTANNLVFYPMVRFSSDTDATYEPYKTTTYPLSDIELRGIPKLVSGAIEYDGDSYEADGTVTRKYLEVDMGDISWTRYAVGGGYIFYGDVAMGMRYPSGDMDVELICSKYAVQTYKSVGAAVFVNGADKTIAINGSGTYATRYMVKDDAYTTAAAFKTAVTGAKIVSLLATPTTETADAYENPQIVETGGTESYVDGRTVEMPVGNVSEYCEAVKSVSIGMRMGKGLSVKMRMGGEL